MKDLPVLYEADNGNVLRNHIPEIELADHTGLISFREEFIMGRVR